MEFSRWVARWKAALLACERIGGEIRELVVDLPAEEDDVRRVERNLGFKLPSSLRTVLIEFARRVDFKWYLPDGEQPPGDLRGIFSGECSWDLSNLCALEEGRKHWVRECFPDKANLYDRVWHDKLPFLAVANGDLLAIDLASAKRSPVVYLSHDDGEGHGCELAVDFIDFIERWTQIGCPGAEDWQWLPFVSGPKSFIDPNCPNALKWREWFGLKLV